MASLPEISQKKLALNAFIKDKSAGHVVLHEVLSAAGPAFYCAMCTICQYQVQWSYNIHEAFGIELDLLESFCENHVHGVVKKLSEPVIDEDSFLTASKIKEQVEKLSGPMIMHPNMVEDIKEDGDPFNLLGNLQVSGNTVTAISSESIKLIARKSNFNVDVQCKPGIQPKYRAVCTQCTDHMLITREDVLALDRSVVEPNLEAFLTLHQHIAVALELPKGRKFRNASTRNEG